MLLSGEKLICRVCRSQTIQKGFLFRCSASECAAAHWDKGSLRKIFKKAENKEFSKQRLIPDLENVLVEAGVPYKEKDLGKFVYQVRLRGKLAEGAKGKIYVGKTGLHPYERFLHHIRGYKASTHVKRLGTAIISFEGPMSDAEALQREPELAEELKREGWEVYGGH